MTIIAFLYFCHISFKASTLVSGYRFGCSLSLPTLPLKINPAPLWTDAEVKFSITNRFLGIGHWPLDQNFYMCGIGH